MIYNKKSLGQNFLIDKNVINKIIKNINIKNENILEIGPGTGNLTEKILKSDPKNFCAIEKDKQLYFNLKKNYSNFKKFDLINKDILRINLEKILKKETIIFGNLPYNISTKILTNLIRFKIWPPKYKKLILMFQKEVAERILADVNSKKYSRITILSKWKFDIKKVIDVKANSFFPKPKVQSTVLKFIPKKKFHEIKDPKNLEKITNVFFNQRRKMIKKPLNILFKDTKEIIDELDLNIGLLPQNLKKETFYKICLIYEKLI